MPTRLFPRMSVLRCFGARGVGRLDDCRCADPYQTAPTVERPATRPHGAATEVPSQVGDDICAESRTYVDAPQETSRLGGGEPLDQLSGQLLDEIRLLQDGMD